MERWGLTDAEIEAIAERLRGFRCLPGDALDLDCPRWRTCGVVEVGVIPNEYHKEIHLDIPEAAITADGKRAWWLCHEGGDLGMLTSPPGCPEEQHTSLAGLMLPEMTPEQLRQCKADGYANFHRLPTSEPLPPTPPRDAVGRFQFLYGVPGSPAFLAVTD